MTVSQSCKDLNKTKKKSTNSVFSLYHKRNEFQFQLFWKGFRPFIYCNNELAMHDTDALSEAPAPMNVNTETKL